MKYFVSAFLSFLLLTSPLFAQSERPETIIIPVSSMGDVSDIRKQILQNTLTNELKTYFRIAPQEKYEAALEQVFQELNYEECTEDSCIIRIQEMLQVEDVFNLQVIGEGKNTQLNLTWRTLDEKSNEEDYCEGCGTRELRKMIGVLVEKLAGRKIVVEKPMEIVKKRQKGVLYNRKVNGKWGWFKRRISCDPYDIDNCLKYEGEMENGQPNGQGTLSWGDGSTYIGQVENGKSHGQGTYTWSDGAKYIGEYKNGERHGQGTFTYPDGGKYVGQFKENKRNGQGTINWSDGRKYVGGWKDGKWNGQGTFISPSGQKYVGNWKDGERNGQGTITLPNGLKYVGEWKVGKFHGQGTLTRPDAVKYVGEFRGNKPWNTTISDKHGNILSKYLNGKKQ